MNLPSTPENAAFNQVHITLSESDYLSPLTDDSLGVTSEEVAELTRVSIPDRHELLVDCFIRRGLISDKEEFGAVMMLDTLSTLELEPDADPFIRQYVLDFYARAVQQLGCKVVLAAGSEE